MGGAASGALRHDPDLASCDASNPVGPERRLISRGTITVYPLMLTRNLIFAPPMTSDGGH